MSISANIKKIVLEKHITIFDLIQGTGVSPSYIYELLRNDKENPSLLITKKIADFLGVTVDELIK
jgi:transcriptional regulator with XRE-family HTH domain